MTQRALDAMRHYFAILWSDLSLQGKLRGAKKLGHDWARECHDIHGYTTEELQEAIFVLDPLLTSTLKEGLYAGWPFWEEAMNYQDAINSIRDVMSVVEDALKDECYDDIVAAKERLGDVDKALRTIAGYNAGAALEVMSALRDLPWLPRDAAGHAASAQKHMMAALKWLDGEVDE